MQDVGGVVEYPPDAMAAEIAHYGTAMRFDEFLDGARMADALKVLVRQNRPSEVVIPGLLEGLDNIRRLVSLWTSASHRDERNLGRARG